MQSAKDMFNGLKKRTSSLKGDTNSPKDRASVDSNLSHDLSTPTSNPRRSSSCDAGVLRRASSSASSTAKRRKFPFRLDLSRNSECSNASDVSATTSEEPTPTNRGDSECETPTTRPSESRTRVRTSSTSSVPAVTPPGTSLVSRIKQKAEQVIAKKPSVQWDVVFEEKSEDQRVVVECRQRHSMDLVSVFQSNEPVKGHVLITPAPATPYQHGGVTAVLVGEVWYRGQLMEQFTVQHNVAALSVSPAPTAGGMTPKTGDAESESEGEATTAVASTLPSGSGSADIKPYPGASFTVATKYNFLFPLPKKHESYIGLNYEVCYKVNVTIADKFIPLSSKLITHPIWVTNVDQEKSLTEPDSGLKPTYFRESEFYGPSMDMGVVGRLRVNLHFNKNVFHMQERIFGFVVFTELNIDIQYGEVTIAQKEVSGKKNKNGPKEQDVLLRHEFLDGTPALNDPIAIRFDLQAIARLTPSYPNIEGWATVTYVVGVVLIDSSNRYFKQFPIEIYRKVGQEIPQNIPLDLKGDVGPWEEKPSSKKGP